METKTAELHCERCLQGAHRLCGIYTPSKWEGGGGRCVCKCVARNDSRLTNVERANESARANAVPVARTRTPKPPKTFNHDSVNPTKWTDQRILQLCSLSAEGLTSRQIAARLGDVSMDTVRTYLSVAKKKGLR